MPLTATNPFGDTLALRLPNREEYDISTLSWGTGVRWQDLRITARSNSPDVAFVTERPVGRNGMFMTIQSRGLASGAETSSIARIVIDVTDTADSDNKRQYTIEVTVTPNRVSLPPSDTETNVDSPDELPGNTVRGTNIYAGQTITFDLTPYTEAGAWAVTSNTPSVVIGARANTDRTLTITAGGVAGEYAIELTKGTEVLTIQGTILAVPATQSFDYTAPRQVRLSLGQTFRLPLAQYNWDTLTGDSDIELSDLEFSSQLNRYDLDIVTVTTGANNAYLQFTARDAGTLRRGARWRVFDENDRFLGTFTVQVSVRNVKGVTPAPSPVPMGPAEAPLPVEPIEDPEDDAASINDRPAIALPSTTRWELAHRSIGKVSEVKLEQGILSFRCDDAHVIKGRTDNMVTPALGGPFKFVGRYSEDGIDVAWPESVKDQIDAAS